MTNVAVTNTFIASTLIEAAKVNQNFQDLVTFLNSTGVLALQDGAVSDAAKMAINVVTTSKILDGAVTPAKRSTAVQASAERAAGTSTLLGTAYGTYLTTGNLAATGRPILVSADVTLGNAGSGASRAIDAVLVMDGVAQGPVRSWDVILTDNVRQPYTISTIIEAPSVGNHVFGLQARCPSSAAAVAIKEGRLSAVEL